MSHPFSSEELAAEELAVKSEELEVRRHEAAKALADAGRPWWRRADPLVLAVLAGALTLLGNMVAAVLNNHYTLNQEEKKAADDLALEQTKARYNLVLQAMATSDASVAKRNVHFFIDAGLLADDDCRIRNAIDQDQPVLPALSGVSPPTPAGTHSATELAATYNFPEEYDGRGVTIGIFEFGGRVIPEDAAAYFKSLNLPPPDISSVRVSGASADDGADSNEDYEVMLDVEIVGAIAPRARIRVYFGPFTPQGYRDIIAAAEADHASVLASGWGQPEDRWKRGEIDLINSALAEAASRGITVIAAAGDRGATDGENDGRRHVDFPASSPWVLSVGGTALKSENGRIVSERVWHTDDEFATGGGVSEEFERPDWQSTVGVPKRDDGRTGRGVPDVAASADPQLGVNIVLHGKSQVIGGSGAVAPIWAGLIARIDQAVGYNVGYINPSLYRAIGPSGAFHAVTSGDNSVAGVKGYSAGPGSGWSAVAGWGSPDGSRLLNWFRAHPNPPPGSPAAACRAISR